MLVPVKYIRFFAARFVQRTYNRAAPQLWSTITWWKISLGFRGCCSGLRPPVSSYAVNLEPLERTSTKLPLPTHVKA